MEKHSFLSMVEMLKIAIEPSNYLLLVAANKTNQHPQKFTLPRIALLYDRIYYGNPSAIEILDKDPYGQFSDIADKIFPLMGKYPPPTIEQIKDVQAALGDPPGFESGHIAYMGLRAILAFVHKESCHFYVPQGLREPFLKFCLKYEPDYLPMLKESFLLLNILENLYDQELPSFDPIKAGEELRNFIEYKKDFQRGLLDYVGQFEGYYELSRDQTSFLKKSLARDEKKLLDFLQPRNLKKYNLPETAGKIILGLIPSPISIDTLYEIGKEIKKVRDFKKAGLDFILSLIILKQISNIGKAETKLECRVCALSLAEIESMSEEACEGIVNGSELCGEHIVARLDLRKRFQLMGKSLLKAMKKLGDLSIYLDR